MLFCRYSLIFLVLLLISACQSFSGDDVPATLSMEMTAYVTESALLQSTAVIEQTHAVETLQASSTLVAEVMNVNMALVATVQSSVNPTPAIRAVVVNPEDMGNSLDGEMIEDAQEMLEDVQISDDIQVDNLGTARGVMSSDGCSNGLVTDFITDTERIYFTARIINLQTNVNFSVDWVFEQRLVYRSTWTSDYSAQSECIWFYMTPDDAPFLPGLYTVTLYINGQSAGTQQFSINTG